MGLAVVAGAFSVPLAAWALARWLSARALRYGGGR